jgi:hypothetical protein
LKSKVITGLQTDQAEQSVKERSAKKVCKQKLVNLLNYVNFSNADIIVHLRHRKFNEVISITAKPQPCKGDILQCFWNGPSKNIFASFDFLYFVIDGGLVMTTVQPEVQEFTEEGIVFSLGEECAIEYSRRKSVRRRSTGVNAEVLQNGVLFSGVLRDFSGVSFSIAIPEEAFASFRYLNPGEPVMFLLKKQYDILFSGAVRIISQRREGHSHMLIVEPTTCRINRYKNKEYRSSRHRIIPLPSMVFDHPFGGATFSLEIEDLGGSGFSVEEHASEAALFPGLILPEVEIVFASDFSIKCQAQVVYRKTRSDGKNDYVRFGIAFLDMDNRDQIRLSAYLHHYSDNKSYVCNKVSQENLWRFFFESGFIYPEKYSSMEGRKENFRETYRRLYMDNAYIARHFIYQEKGAILGHMAMVRFYENAWLIHHHAASRAGNLRAGVAVLNQVGRYVNEFHSLRATHMNYVICYFRDNNKFPSRVFGGCATALKNPKSCSLDSFAYHKFIKGYRISAQEEIELENCQPADIEELKRFYEHHSGGGMLKAFDLEPDLIHCEDLNREFEKIGFKRHRKLFSLRKKGHLKAVIMVNISDVGLNFSNLTNCMHFFAVDEEDLSYEDFEAAISRLSGDYEETEIPVLIYPTRFVVSANINYEKLYTLWVLNVQALDQYFEFIDSLFARHHRENNEIKNTVSE